jgi:molybdopterin synthase sulfur carrier subunit
LIQVLYFAWLREKIGTSAEKLSLPPHITTVGELVDWLAARGPGHAAAFADRKLVRCAVNQELAGPGAHLAGAEEIAFFPPVTGG